MLVLARKCQQAVVVEGCGVAAQMLTVTVLQIRGGRVKLGFEVAADVPVHRREIGTRLKGKDGADSPTKGPAERRA